MTDGINCVCVLAWLTCAVVFILFFDCDYDCVVVCVWLLLFYYYFQHETFLSSFSSFANQIFSAFAPFDNTLTFVQQQKTWERMHHRLHIIIICCCRCCPLLLLLLRFTCAFIEYNNHSSITNYKLFIIFRCSMAFKYIWCHVNICIHCTHTVKCKCS